MRRDEDREIRDEGQENIGAAKETGGTQEKDQDKTGSRSQDKGGVQDKESPGSGGKGAGAGDERCGEESELPAESLREKLEKACLEIDSLTKERDEWKSKAQAIWDQYLRARADMENFRKRTERDIEDRVRRGKADFLLNFLEVVDNFERFLSAGEKTLAGREDSGFRAFVKGVEMIYRQMMDLLSKEGVVPIECPVGKQLDPQYHEAVMTQDGGGEHGTVVEELRRGYLYRGNVLRPSRVKVIK
ncbi:MAG: nucleotide exchange factor GrpE [Candidatus Fermentithermobacillus carboniphilus]|uniref:Protein GrpE n=1 Tax=Candidatus Fermentithermobacillus carboniphilus TaxID=3085328 RepID=A0AAT9LD46_9FIRM|nr:MAG: nucleotide exchange factor GrpE [Candidatus Fermentithermobacillus carboniphilus]